jgi:flagellar FliJ protein
MPMQRHVLDTLKDIAAKELDLVAERLASLNKALDEANTKLVMLHEYRDSYLAKFESALKQGLAGQSYINYQNFLNKLDQAIVGQKDNVEFARQKMLSQRELWQESQRKKLSFDVLSDRSDQHLHQDELRREQKAMDEHAMRHGKFNRQ